MALSDLFQRMGDERYVSLTTFRRNGEPVATAVWVAPEGDALVVTTGGASGKVKRLRNDAHVELRPCTRAGEVADGAPVARGQAQVVDDPSRAAQLRQAIATKYGDEYTASGAGDGTDGVPSVMLRITEGTASGGSGA